MKKIGKYEIVESLGEGGVGTVFKAYDPLMQREVAIKVLQRRSFDVPEIKERFYREAQSAGKLSHENITIVHDLGEVDGDPYIVMEYLSGTDLREIIQSRKSLSLKQKLEIALQISHGCAYSHSKGIVHRDIKPENIRVLEDGKVKIMDFGIAKPSASTMTQTGTVMGTPYYMSPEQIRGLKVDKASDIWSFGVVLYELLGNKLPFSGDSHTTISYKIAHEEPEPLESPELGNLPMIVNTCLQKNPAQRYDSFNSIKRDLEEALTRAVQQEEADKAAAAQAETRLVSPGQEETVLLKGEPEAPHAERTKPPKRRLSKKQMQVAGAAILSVVLIVLAYQFWPTGAPQPAYVALNVLPWAEVTRVTDDNGSEVALPEGESQNRITPCRLALPAGTYQIHFENPVLASSFQVSVTAEAGKVQTVRRTVPGFDQEAFFSQLE